MTSIAVIGATGRTGRLIIQRALADGHHVTAIARRPQSLASTSPRLTTAIADIHTPGSLHGLLDDHDAVISALGANGRGPTTVYSAGTAEIISAMKPRRRERVCPVNGVTRACGV
ncbi:NAD(P)H-binding protein [Actinomadura sp. DSM 109109]|nr:NAD(P)H-binding protein [Actinomadura lepetitiana]